MIIVIDNEQVAVANSHTNLYMNNIFLGFSNMV